MEDVKNLKPSYQLNDDVKFSQSSLKLITDINEKPLYDFISCKNKILFKSCFDKKGSKKFLSEKSKAMEKIILFDDLLEKKQKKNHIRKNIKQINVYCHTNPLLWIKIKLVIKM